LKCSTRRRMQRICHRRVGHASIPSVAEGGHLSSIACYDTCLATAPVIEYFNDRASSWNQTDEQTQPTEGRVCDNMVPRAVSFAARSPLSSLQAPACYLAFPLPPLRRGFLFGVPVVRPLSQHSTSSQQYSRRPAVERIYRLGDDLWQPQNCMYTREAPTWDRGHVCKRKLSRHAGGSYRIVCG